MACGSKLVIAGTEFTCVMNHHTKPNTLGPTHMARTRADDGTIVVLNWPTKRG